ncbi:diacylglycerol/lipid kinase family protein [Anaerosoma tenue]|uniref:diacylglycerol/lipid kinase family protein n=1 Tax=Anaerosoma tenue TaxID=2933588 RepID=UPI002260B839|nr:diacylglycerol kinase family protein [Anaerosoma tenue]MCK8114006.1 diacylglycerol kinase family lipid kinase [Anaerosoma tenue]
MTSGSMLLIVNPAARHGETGPLVPAIEQLLQCVEYDLRLTEHTGHAAQIAREASSYDTIVAVGGDGTVHEVLNGIMSRPEHDRPALGLIPTGSGNDTRRTLGVPEDIAEATLAVVSGRRRRFDVGVCNGVYFNNSFAAGLDARVTAKAVEYKATTKRSGLWLYFTALIHVLLNELYPHHVRITWDGSETEEADLLIVAATIGATYGGGFKITPDAVPDDGLLEVCTIDPLSLPQALLRLPFVIIGKHTGMKVVHMSRRRSVLIESDEPMPAQIDGEVLVERRFEISILPEAVECIVPAER